MSQLLTTGKLFTALNGLSAIGAIRALQHANMRVPTDASVIGCWAGSKGTLALRQEIAMLPTLVARESTGPVRH